MSILKHISGKHQDLISLMHIPFPYMITDAQGRIIDIGNGADQLLGGSPQQLIQRPVVDFYHPGDQKEIQALLSELRSGQRETGTLEVRKKTSDGSYLWHRDHIRLIGKGRNRQLLFLSEDLSHLKQAEEKWYDAEHRYRNLVERVPAISYSVDIKASPRTTYISPQVNELLGYTPEEWLSRPDFWHACIHPDDRQRVLAEVERCNVTGDPFFLEYRINTKAGTLLWIRNHGIYRPGDDGRPRYTDGVMIDISDTKRIEEREMDVQLRMARAERMESVGRLAGGVAHDLNNILGSLVGYPELLLEELPADHPMRDDLRIIHDAAKRAAAVVQDLLILARRGNFSKQPADINQVVIDYFEDPSFAVLQEQHPKVEFTMDLMPDIPAVIGSSSILQQLLSNVIVNALESVDEQGVIAIHTSIEELDNDRAGYDLIPPGSYVFLQVHDSGQSIAKKDMEHLFEPFYTRRSMGRGGTGLGLSVVYGIAKDMDGYIDIQSEEGEGTTLTVYLPASDQSVPVRESRGTGPEAGTGRILVVDDLRQQRDLARRILERIGYTVSVARSVEQALDLFEDGDYDLLLLDMILEEDRDGLDLLQAVQARKPDQPCLLMTGYAETERVNQALAQGARGCVRKPYTMETLSRAIRKALS